MRSDDDILLAAAEKVAAGDDVDWSRLAATRPDHGKLFANLRIISAVAGRFSRVPDSGSKRSVDTRPKHQFSWGHLQIIERIGQGGFGEVYRAYDPILCREVALKLRHEKPGNDSASQLFIEEARRMARIRHPNVLAVHGADVRDGRVGMWADLLTGKTVETRLSEQEELNSDDVFSITAAIASALDAIRQAGLIHGDVKASNVMLEVDGGVVLMDFGAGADLENTTQPAAFVSPLSAAPELFDGESASTMADQYSLGVLIHRMLLGCYPIETGNVDELLQWHEARKSGASTLADTLRGPVGQLARKLLQVNPESRPGTSAVLEEIRKIESLPAIRRRNIVAAVIIVSLAVGALLAAAGYIKATRSEIQTARTAMELQSVNEFLQDVLISPRPTDGGRQTTVMELMNRAAERVNSDSSLNPVSRARTLFIIGESFVHMYLWDQAESALRQSLLIREAELGDEHVDTVYSRVMLAAALVGLQQPDAAKLELERVLPQLATIPIDHEVQSQARITQAHIAYDNEELERAQQLFENLLVFRSDPDWPNDPNYLVAKTELTKIMEVRGEYEQAMQHATDLFDLSMALHGERHKQTLNARQLIAIIYDRLGQSDKTLELMTRDLEVAEEWLGEDDRFTYIAMMNVAEATYRTGDNAGALKLQERVVELKEKFYPPDHFNTLTVEANHAAMLIDDGQWRIAGDLLTDLLPRAEASLGPDHYLVYVIRLHTINMFLEGDRPKEALALGNESRSLVIAALGDSHMIKLQIDSALGAANAAVGNHADAERILRETIEKQSEVHGDASLDVMKSELRLAEALAHERPAEALDEFDSLLRKAERTLSQGHSFVTKVTAARSSIAD